jgi:uroporphyrinogen-III decarboxylase
MYVAWDPAPGMATFQFDSKNDTRKAVETMRDRVALVGNLNNPVTLLTKGPDAVAEEVRKCHTVGVGMIRA